MHPLCMYALYTENYIHLDITVSNCISFVEISPFPLDDIIAVWGSVKVQLNDLRFIM